MCRQHVCVRQCVRMDQTYNDDNCDQPRRSTALCRRLLGWPRAWCCSAAPIQKVDGREPAQIPPPRVLISATSRISSDDEARPRSKPTPVEIFSDSRHARWKRNVAFQFLVFTVEVRNFTLWGARCKMTVALAAAVLVLHSGDDA